MKNLLPLLLLFMLTACRTTHVTQIEQPFTIILDPGHGGVDKGYELHTQVTEANLVLELAQEIRQQAEAEGVQVLMTRTEDVEVSLQERQAMAEGIQEGVFLSLHLQGAPSVAQRGYLSIVHLDQPNREASALLAEQLLAALQQHNPEVPAESKEATPRILSGIEIPAVHLDVGYLSNEQDREQLQTTDQRKALAKALVEVLVNRQEK
ncbi:MAG: N-acetylmuramoyl-L-alanine amidase [Bacteroidota bacterium]